MLPEKIGVAKTKFNKSRELCKDIALIIQQGKETGKVQQMKKDNSRARVSFLILILYVKFIGSNFSLRTDQSQSFLHILNL